jgi:crotonobetainyl-CoA:carnitine CoA-transferase CaiB-like acyl-CoA transferase
LQEVELADDETHGRTEAAEDYRADRVFLGAAIEALGLPGAAVDHVRFEGQDSLPSVFAMTAFASAAIGGAAPAVSELVAAVADAPPVIVDRRLASLWFRMSIKPIGWTLPSPWDPIAGDYQAADGWIRLHTNAPRHRTSALDVLDCAAERSIVAEAVKRWSAEALEAAVVEAGGCAAAMRTVAEWEAHPQGRAVFAEPLIAMDKAGAASSGWRPTAARPLAGVKVLDLTRVLAGPVATRFLAGYGADVLRIDPPDWDEPAIEPEVTLGKRCARLDLRQPPDRGRFECLISEADLFIHGYRPEALGALGYGEDIRRALNPSLIDVRLDAYGWSGPWRNRRGFDSLAQMSTGIAAAGGAWRGADKPVPLPVQALDHATGYLMAGAAVRGLALRLSEGHATSARLSLARTAALLMGTPRQGIEPKAQSPADGDYSAGIEATGWGSARRALPPVRLAGAPIGWNRPASRLGSAPAAWG